MTKPKEIVISNTSADYSYNCNMFYTDDDINFIVINDVACCYIDNKTNFTMQILVENKEFFLTFTAKELLMCLNKNTINELKENLKQQIDNL